MTSSVVPARSLVAAGVPVVTGLIAAGLALRIARDGLGTSKITTAYADL